MRRIALCVGFPRPFPNGKVGVRCPAESRTVRIGGVGVSNLQRFPKFHGTSATVNSNGPKDSRSIYVEMRARFCSAMLRSSQVSRWSRCHVLTP